MKLSSENTIIRSTDGWLINENNEMEIEYFSGNPYPDNIANMPIDENDDIDDNSQLNVSSSDEEHNDNDDDEDDAWEPYKKI